MSHRGLTEGEERKALREELDVHSVFGASRFLNQGIDAHFDARSRIIAPDLTLFLRARASEYWGLDSLGSREGKFTIPTGEFTSVVIYSKNVFTVASFKTTLPVLTDHTSKRYYFGFEDDGEVGTGIACFIVYPTAPGYAANHLRLQAGGHFSSTAPGFITAWALPADSATVLHTYSVHLLGPWSEFYIDNSLIGVAINSPNLNFATIDGPPYVVFRANAPYSRPQLALLEITSMGLETTLPISPFYVRLSNVPERPPRTFRLYQTGTTTLLANLVVNPNVTSHPVPIFGYGEKTLLFRADEAGTLSIQILTQANNWREYDSVSVVANTLVSYIMTGDAILTRVVFTPTAPPATITDAEVILR